MGLTVIDIARICHNANAGLCHSTGDAARPWEFASNDERDSAIDGVRFHLAMPDAGDAASHENWMRCKVDQGWKWGPEKNYDLKLHPCLVPFDRLPPAQQAKDRLFRSIVHALAPIVSEEA